MDVYLSRLQPYHTCCGLLSLLHMQHDKHLLQSCSLTGGVYASLPFAPQFSTKVVLLLLVCGALCGELTHLCLPKVMPKRSMAAAVP